MTATKISFIHHISIYIIGKLEVFCISMYKILFLHTFSEDSSSDASFSDSLSFIVTSLSPSSDPATFTFSSSPNILAIHYTNRGKPQVLCLLCFGSRLCDILFETRPARKFCQFTPLRNFRFSLRNFIRPIIGIKN